MVETHCETNNGIMQMLNDEQWRRAMEYVSMVSELNYMSQIVIMLYEDPTKDPSSEERFHIELHFSPGVNCCVQKNLPPGPGFRPHSRNESAASKTPSPDSSTTPTPEEKSQTLLEDGKIEVIEEEKILMGTPTIAEVAPLHLLQCEHLEAPANGASQGRRSRLKKSSSPIPIGNAHTVCGNEARQLAKCLTEELANQATQSVGRSFATNRAVSPETEPRARSYDHKTPPKGKGKSLESRILDGAESMFSTHFKLVKLGILIRLSFGQLTIFIKVWTP
ncbi:hypothetical protein D910_12762 [Dendroctonus ponderosae]|uniref:Uncharacterized protein n=1 Tax=Dendroctonus ponderosae TaxID=77166 RepID=U4UYU2_DENPD|nr:hypothetical protein D910_12762 [Dendroctonus ponderosae]